MFSPKLTAQAMLQHERERVARAERAGQRIIDLLQLEVRKNGRVRTIYGEKSSEGLARALDSILKEEKV